MNRDWNLLMKEEVGGEVDGFALRDLSGVFEEKAEEEEEADMGFSLFE